MTSGTWSLWTRLHVDLMRVASNLMCRPSLRSLRLR
ncbi:putative leader peptide [Spelaeicoccus albus]|uniref:Uncharacterized protein n=1 Tax=Spelaeicoccus albus TaxID=1280376 RepID=A0A7Z0AAG8_9MICO|nr:hypothetical protein [Spelaeicoccus albus]